MKTDRLGRLILGEGEAIVIMVEEDSLDHEAKVVPVVVRNDYGRIEICPEGYGDASSQDGHGVPIFIEHWEGHLGLIAWADINQEDPTHKIDMEGAREDKRELEGDGA